MVDLMPLLYLVAGAIGSSIMWILLGGRLAGRGVIWKIKKWDENTEEAFEVLLDKLVSYLSDEKRFNGFMTRVWNWLNTSTIKTGRKIQMTNEKGEILSEAEEILSPVQNFIAELGRYVSLKFSAARGGLTKAALDKLEAAAQDPNNPNASSLSELVSMVRGRKGRLSMEDIAWKLIDTFINKKGPGGSGGGGQGW